MDVRTPTLRARLTRHATFANVVALIALFVALSGTAAAAIVITGANVRNASLTGADIKAGSLTGLQIRNRSLTAVDFVNGQLPAGATGATGPAGPQGAPGPAGPAGAAGAPGTPGFDLASATYIRVAADGSASSNAAALRSALAAITDASASKPYVLALGRGAYDLGDTTLELKPYVSLEGAGSSYTSITTTALAGVADYHFLLRPANGSVVSDLEVRLTGLGSRIIYVMHPTPNAAVELRDVAVVLRGGTANESVAIYESGSQSLSADHVKLDIAAGSGTGVYLTNTATADLTSSRLDAGPGQVAYADNTSALRISYSAISGGAFAAIGATVTCGYLTNLAAAPFATASTCPN